MKNKSVPLNLSINPQKTSKDQIYAKKYLKQSEDKLNLSVDVGGKQGVINRNNVDNNLRLSRISEEKLNISVDGISSARGNKSIID